MEGNIVKVLDRGLTAVDGEKRKASRHAVNVNQESQVVIPQPLGLKAPSIKLGKRKTSGNCVAKCRGFASRKSLYRSYTNFKKSTLPRRLMCFQNDGWVDLPSEVVGLVKKDFELKKGAIEVKFNGRHLLLDFLHMVQLDVIDGLEQPMAWIDEAGSCFFPEVFAFDDVDDECHAHFPDGENTTHFRAQGQRDIRLQIDIDVNGFNVTPMMEQSGESSPPVKRVKISQRDAFHDPEAEAEGSCDGVSIAKTVKKIERTDENLDLRVESTDGSLASQDVVGMFLKGMNLVGGVDIVNVSRCSSTMAQARRELFEKQVEITSKFRGYANVRYGWLASSKESLSGIMAYGLVPLGLPRVQSYGTRVPLAAANCSGISAKHCDVDENGERHMVLCRVIMGSMELIGHESNQFHPSSEEFDNAVDDLQNPQQYIIWSMNINTHICPEFAVSFKISPTQEVSLAGSDKLGLSGVTAGQQSPEVRSNNVACSPRVNVRGDYQSNLASGEYLDKAINSDVAPARTQNVPNTPFPVLFAAIANKVSAGDMRVICMYYELYRTKKVPRVEFVRMLRLIVGDPLLRSTMNTLQRKGPPDNGSTPEVPKREAET